MWDQLTFADVDRAKQSLSERRAETSARHAEEVESLQTKQAEEMHSLNAKEAEIELLNKLINDFKQEFMSEVATASEPTAIDEIAAVQTEELDEIGVLVAEKEATISPLSSNTEPTPDPAQLQVLYPSPNFSRIRKIGS
jgi:hypothetical protein